MTNIDKRKYHPLGFISFILAVIILFLPLQADIVWICLRHDKFLPAFITVVSSLIIVVLPLLLAERGIRLHPNKWKPRFLTKLTWGIIILNIILNTYILFATINHKLRSEQKDGLYQN